MSLQIHSSAIEEFIYFQIEINLTGFVALKLRSSAQRKKDFCWDSLGPNSEMLPEHLSEVNLD